jgi:hypothetical protein
MEEKPVRSSKRARFWLAIVLSAAVVVGAALNVDKTGTSPISISLENFGQWLSGVAGALAFIWLIVSYFQQGEELELQREELALTRAEMAKLALQAERQAETASEQQKIVANTELHQRRDTFGRMADMMVPELSAICMQLGAPFQSEDDRARIWQRVGAGDRLFPVRRLAGLVDSGVEQFRVNYIDSFDGIEAVAPRLERYCEVYEQLSSGAERADPDGDLLRYYEGSGLRTVYTAFCQILARGEVQVRLKVATLASPRS